VVEDDTDLRRMLARFLEHEGFRVVTAENGKAALEHCESTLPDVILADLMMPLMDGEDFLVEYRRRYPSAHTPVIIASASEIRDQVAARLEIAAVLKKPFDMAQLKQVLQAYAVRPSDAPVADDAPD